MKGPWVTRVDISSSQQECADRNMNYRLSGSVSDGSLMAAVLEGGQQVRPELLPRKDPLTFC